MHMYTFAWTYFRRCKFWFAYDEILLSFVCGCQMFITQNYFAHGGERRNHCEIDKQTSVFVGNYKTAELFYLIEEKIGGNEAW